MRRRAELWKFRLSACALLRIVIRSVIQERVRGRHIVRDVATLVDQGAPVGLLRALDVVSRVKNHQRTQQSYNLSMVTVTPRTLRFCIYRRSNELKR